MNVVSDSEGVADLADASLLVVRQNAVRALIINRAVADLESGKAKLLGCILNDMHTTFLSSGQGYRYGNYGGYGGYGYGYDPFGSSWQQSQSYTNRDEQNLRVAQQYIQFRQFESALNILQHVADHNARWYYLSALANYGMGNQITGLEHIRRAVSMEPDNAEYIQALSAMESGGYTYRQNAGQFKGFTMPTSPCLYFLWCLCMRYFCCCC
jgi:molecular chaperone DnaJ